ncbi:MAG: DUF6171 family protein [Acutalibacteraceae bacterium]|nr:DUF6171 family protein [Acutalibacteraceae bacterium]
MEECKRCLLYEAAEKDVLESIKTRINKLSDSEKADDELYKKRLSECTNCDNLISGVCMKCGCYVEFRAAFRNMKCPDVKNRKW